MKKVIAPLLATALLAGGCSVEARADRRNAAYELAIARATMSHEDEVLIRDTFADLRRFWKGSSTARLVILQGTQTMNCPEEGQKTAPPVTSLEGAQYCVSNDTVVMTGGWVAGPVHKFAGADAQKREAGIVVTEAHEYGHGVGRDQLGATQRKVAELQADCMAGKYMYESEEYSMETIGHAEEFLSRLAVDGLVTAGERLDAFHAGMGGLECSKYPSPASVRN